MCKIKAIQSIGTVIFYLMTVCLVFSCSDGQDDALESYETGMVRLGFSNTADFPTKKGRGISTEAMEKYKDINNYKVLISQDGKPIKEYASVQEVPASIELKNGSYFVKAFYGVEHVKSRDEFYSVASKVFTVQGNNQTVDLLCEPTSAKVSVKFDPEMSTYFEDYSVNYSTSALANDVATWAMTDTEPWFLLVQPQGEIVKATIMLTPKAEFQIPAGTIVKTHTLKPNEGWTLRIAPSYDANNGNLGIKVTIDETTEDIPVDIEVPSEWITQE